MKWIYAAHVFVLLFSCFCHVSSPNFGSLLFVFLQTFSCTGNKKKKLLLKMNNCLFYRSRHSSIITSIYILSKAFWSTFAVLLKFCFFCYCCCCRWTRLAKISMINRLKRMIYFVWHWRVWHSNQQNWYKIRVFADRHPNISFEIDIIRTGMLQS